MAMNPIALLKMKERLGTFNQDHPKVRQFFHKIKEEGLPVGSILELKVTHPDGREEITNIRLTENDIETLRMLSSLGKDKKKDSDQL